MIKIKTPSKAYISDDICVKITKYLSYENKTALHEVNRIKNNRWLKSSNPSFWELSLAEAQQKVKCTLVFEDEFGFYIRPGSIPYLIDEGFIKEDDVVNSVDYPKKRPYRWYNPLPFTLYDYQKTSIEFLSERKHASVSLCTGAGKSAIILKLAQEHGLRTVVSVPSESIFSELLKAFEFHFGKDSVGCLGDGKKRLGKLFTVCIADSIASMKEDSEAYQWIRGAQVLIVDESHTFAAETLDQVCHGPLANIPYRYFLSGTQTRGDGTKKLLESIISKVVYSFSTEQAISGGFVCNHEFRILTVPTSSTEAIARDPLVNKRNHFLRNANIRDFVAKLANISWTANKHQTLVLVEELSQIAALIPHLKVPFAVATSASNKNSILASLLKIPEKTATSRFEELFANLTPEQLELFNLIKNSEPGKAVELFNLGEARVLIGTSCISVGTNIFPTHNTVNWQGGSSEVKTKQGAVGRSVRLLEKSKYKNYHEPKPKSVIWDFDVMGLDDLKNHLYARIRYYKDSGVPIKEIK